MAAQPQLSRCSMSCISSDFVRRWDAFCLCAAVSSPKMQEQSVLNQAWLKAASLNIFLSLALTQFYWLNVNAGYDGDVYLTIVLNGFIHTVMYTYYFVSMHTKDIWWKKYLTLMQVCILRVYSRKLLHARQYVAWRTSSARWTFRYEWSTQLYDVGMSRTHQLGRCNADPL